MVDKTIIEKLDRCLLKGRPILFTGAGFSRYGKNSQNNDIPMGNDLKKLLLTEQLGYDENSDEFKNLMGRSLSDIYSFAKEEKSEQKIEDYVVSLFSGCQPMPYHKIIANYNWKKVYTTNIDDLFENSVENAGRLLVQNMHHHKEINAPTQREYIKLHGCVRNQSLGIVFSNSEYIDSMLKSQDYRFNSFGSDMQTEDFIFIGTEMDEMNLDYYLKLFSNVQGRTTHGQLFFFNPSPDPIFLSKIKSKGGYVISWTTEEFASHIEQLSGKVRVSDYLYRLDGYLCVNELLSQAKKIEGYRSNLYLGNDPVWNDIFFDWDFILPQISQLKVRISNAFDSGHSKKMIVSLCGKSMCGKSVYLKRLGMELINENFVVYEYIGRRFNYQDFLRQCRIIPDERIALIIDNGSYYYSAIHNLVRSFNLGKSLLVITSSRPYYHNRKRYNLVMEDVLIEENLTGGTVTAENEFARAISGKLSEKGLLGEIKSLSPDDRVRYISKINDVSTLLYTITYGNSFKKRQLDVYAEMQGELGEGKSFLQLLAIFQKVELPYFPLELLGLWDSNHYSKILDSSEEFIKYTSDNNGVELRNDILTNILLKDLSSKDKMKMIRDVLILVSPQVSDNDHSYWNEIQSSLMKGKLLKKKIGISQADVKEMLFSIQNYYNDNFNYWIQVGIAEQNENEFETSLNHFKQAESISQHSYLVLNAIARNYMLHANSKNNYAEAKPLFEEGERRILKLIKEREEFQVKAFSTHGYLFEKLRYLQKFNLRPSPEELKQMYEMLKSILDRDSNDPMAKHVSNLFLKYIRKSGLSNKLHFKQNDLSYLYHMVSDDKQDIKALLEDYEIE